MENVRMKISTIILLSLSYLSAFSQLYRVDYEVISGNLVRIKAGNQMVMSMML